MILGILPYTYLIMTVALILIMQTFRSYVCFPGTAKTENDTLYSLAVSPRVSSTQLGTIFFTSK